MQAYQISKKKKKRLFFVSVSVMCEFTKDSWKMYRYTVEERVFIVRTYLDKIDKYGVPGSILSGRKWWPLSAHVMMFSYILHNEVSPIQISLQYPH